MALPDAVRDRLEGWKAKLIDLSRMNRLLSYRHHRASSIRIVQEDPREILSLVTAGKKLALDPMAEGLLLAKDAPLRTGDLRLQTDLAKEPLAKVLQKLERDARASIEEQGFNTLFLALGVMEFTVPGDGEKWRAPLMLVPVQLTRRGARSDFALSVYEDEIRVNPALPLKLQNVHGIKISIPEAEDGLSYDTVRAAFHAVTAGREGWAVEDEVHLAPFSFAKIPLYEDLVRYGDLIGSRPIVTTIATGVPSPELRLGPLPEPHELEAAPEAGQTSPILDADSSQEAALLAARRGQSFVMQGPPGTGKSQTIANVIADALATGKTVLFVSEKMAALEVVKRRLDQAGLGDFCLELHSQKANRREVAQSLGRAWKRAFEGATAAAGRPAELREVREYLQTYASELARTRGSAGLSTHKILGESTRLSAVPRVQFALPAPQSIDGAGLQRIHRALREGAELRRAVEPVAQNPWRGARRTALATSTLDDARKSLNLLHTGIDEARRAAAKLSSLTSVPPATTASTYERSLEIAAHLQGTPRPGDSLLQGRSCPALSTRGSALVANGVELQGLREKLLERYEPAILDVDARAWIPRARAGGGPFGWLRRRKLRKELAAHLRAGSMEAGPETIKDLTEVGRARELAACLEAEQEWLRATLGNSYTGPTGDWRRVSDHVAWVRRLLELWPSDSEPDPLARSLAGGAGLDALGHAAQSARSALSTLQVRWEVVVALLQLEASSGGDWGDVELGALETECERMLGAIDALPDWVAWQAKRSECGAAGLGGYLDAFDKDELESRHLLNGWFRAFYSMLADSALEESPVLNGFQGPLHESRIQRYRDLEGKQLLANAARTAGVLRTKVPSPSMGTVADSEVGVLKRQTELEKRHMPTRKLFDRIPTLLRTLKPCLMMSPLSVATYLPPDREQFDLVVFDEASQICTEDAIGALARGKQVIVAGDSKQLPPTAFFESRLAERDDAPEDALVEMKSILEECSAGQLPERPLKWHYRSRDESLISFSNTEFYGDLVTFPNPDRNAQELGISMVHVKDGVYDVGKTRVNGREAEMVADRVFQLLRERRGKDSIGVVTFGTAQRDAILDAIDARRRVDDSFEANFSEDALEPVFVKNIEAVQGDERDVILFSIGYGRDASGNFSHNFGPLNLDGGERRLNVAVSRARKQMIVFASIQPEDIDLNRVTRRGGKLLRSYLERARRGLSPAVAERAVVNPETLSSLVRAVLVALEDGKHGAEANLGESGFKIDVAVRHPVHRDRFVLGILCDTPGAPGTLTVSDRERIRHEVLTRLGWKLHRVWAPEWLRFPERERKRLYGALEAAVKESAAPRIPVSGESESVPPLRPPAPMSAADSAPRRESGPPERAGIPGIEPYRVARLARTGSPQGFHEGPLDVLCGALEAVLRVEGPVHLAVASRRLAEAWQLERVTERVLGRVALAAGELGRRRRLVQRGAFLWSPEQTVAVARGPGDGVQRQIDQIAPEELAEAMLRVVAACLSLSEDALVRETARLLGFQRVGDQLGSALSALVQSLLTDGRLSRDASGWLRRP